MTGMSQKVRLVGYTQVLSQRVLPDHPVCEIEGNSRRRSKTLTLGKESCIFHVNKRIFRNLGSTGPEIGEGEDSE